MTTPMTPAPRPTKKRAWHWIALGLALIVIAILASEPCTLLTSAP